MQIIVVGILIGVAIIGFGVWFHYMLERERKRDIRYGNLIQDALSACDEDRGKMLLEEWRAGRVGCCGIPWED